MFFRTMSVLSLSMMMGLAGIAVGHGPQLQVTANNGKIVTREIFLDEPYSPLTDPKSVYVIPMLSTAGQYFSRPNDEEAAPGVPAFNSGPGLAFGLGSTFNSGFNFRLTFVDGLKLWDGSAFVDPGLEQIQAFRGSSANPSASATTSDVGPFAFLNFPTIANGYTDSAHNSGSFRLLGDGVSPTAASQDGVYLLSLQLQSTDPNLSPSDPYYFVLYKNVPLSTALEATRLLNVAPSSVQVVPEASSLVLGLLGTVAFGGAVVARRRRASH
ncbi:hypothetical protein K2X85_07115 [bacterium]|nr:hypothetical protein [bacterium]